MRYSVLAVVAATALLGACSFAARTGHNYAKQDGMQYSYQLAQSDADKKAGKAPELLSVRYAGTVNGREYVLGEQDGQWTALMSCEKPCETIKASGTPAPTPTQDMTFKAPSDGGTGLLDFVFDDVNYGKLKVDPTATEIVKKAYADAAAKPADAKPAEGEANTDASANKEAN